MYQVLIVEDEAWIRRGIIESIDWERLSLELAGEVANGRDALQLLEDHPVDIIVTDMKMPVCDGREMLAEIERRGIACEIIVLSEHADFAYMQQAIHAHVADYLLKPIDPGHLNDLLAKSATRVTRRRVLADTESDPFIRLFSHVLNGSPQAQMEEVYLQSKAQYKKNSFFISCLQPEFPQVDAAPLLPALMAAVADAPYSTSVLPCPGDVAIYCLFSLIPCPGNAGITHKYRNWLNHLFAQLRAVWGSEVRIGTTNHVEDALHLRAALEESLTALDFFCRGAGAVIPFDRVKQLVLTPVHIPVSTQKLTNMLKKCDAASALEIKTVVADALRKEPYLYLPTIRKVLMDFTSALEKSSGEAGYVVNITALLGENYFDRISRMEWLAEVDAFLSEVLDGVLGSIRASRSLGTADVIQRVIDLIETHYMDSISLMQLSEQYHINYMYLSRRFKERTGQTFTDYLFGVRMGKARELIERDGMSERDVAPLVGYSNVYYFTGSYRKQFDVNREIGREEKHSE